MRVRTLIGLASVWTLMAVSPVVAGVTMTLIDRGTPTDGVNSANGFRAWVVHFTSDSGNINGFDLENSDRGIFGPMVQRWTSSSSNGIYDISSAVHTAQNLVPRSENFDSHLLVQTLLPGPPPFESLGTGSFPPVGSTVGGGMPSNTNDSGIGVSGTDGFIKGTYGIVGPEQATSMDFAYIVMRDGELNQLSGRVLVGTAGGMFEIVIPEPVLSVLLPLLIGHRFRRKWQ